MKRNTLHTFLVADDHSIVRNGLAFLIKSTFQEALVYQAGTIDEIQKQLDHIEIELLILDIDFPEGTTLELVSELKIIRPEMKILIFSSYEEEVFALRYIKAGADGFLSKLSSPDEIQNALESIQRNGKYTSNYLKDKLIGLYQSNQLDNPLESLSDREYKVASLFVKGYGNLEISNELNLKATTISTYKSRVFEKLQITNLPSLIKLFQLYND